MGSYQIPRFFLTQLILTGLLSVFCVAQSAMAQGRPDPNAAAISILKNLDKNKDGKLDPIEIPARSKASVSRLAKEAGLDSSKALSISKLVSQLQKSESDKRKDEKRERKEEKKEERRDRDRGGDRGRDRDRRDRDDGRGGSRETRNTSSKSEGSSKGFGSSTKSSNSGSSSSGRGFGGGSRSASKGKYSPDVLKYVDRLISRYDKNKNGYLDRTEWQSVRWSNDPKESDLNKDGRLSKDELCERIDKRFNRGKSESSSSSRGSSSSSSKERSRSSSSGDKVRRYAEGLMRRYDKNKNGVLEKDEWGKLRGDPKEYDRNRDGVLNVDELAAKLGGGSSSSSSSSRSSRSSRSSSTASKSDRSSRSSRTSRGDRRRDDDRSSRWSRVREKPKADEERNSYRVQTAHERLPRELSSSDRRWFIDKDKDKDGQIMMSEFSSTWSTTKAKEFLEYDLNNDGVIVPSEMIESDD